MKTIVFIPARGGSKGVPRKNVRFFAGKPLVVHSIEQALGAEGIDAVIVSTDDQEIATISQNAGAQIITRPASLSGDKATSESALAHALGELEQQGETIEKVVFLQATSPLRPKNCITEALARFDEGKFDSLLSISPTHRFFWRVQGDKAVAEYDFLNRPCRQDILPEDIRYVENGSLYIFSTEHFKKVGNRLGGKIGYILFEEEYSFEIDSETDFRVLEEVAKSIF
ncbi:MAG: acylneuraminate cytidylyltransferase family protein [Cyclobacteriaceae bacterium]|nr:acylneuraminate cytidylyltransferase family protein [Cyclobacteriaceae bacterium]